MGAVVLAPAADAGELRQLLAPAFPGYAHVLSLEAAPASLGRGEVRLLVVEPMMLRQDSFETLLSAVARSDVGVLFWTHLTPAAASLWIGITCERYVRPRLAWTAALAVLLIGVRSRSSESQVSPRLRGRIVTDSGAPILGATVVVTAVPSALTATAASDSVGGYRLVLPERTQEYVALFTAAGRRSVQRRLTLTPGASEITADVVLYPQVVGLNTVRIQATRPRPDRQAGMGAEGILPVGMEPGDHTADGVKGALSADEATDIAALASMVPGLVVSGGTVSALGLGSESNVTALNGMTAPLSALPSDAKMSVRYTLSPWDPTLGGGSGARASVTFSSGTNISSHRLRAIADLPSLWAYDQLSATPRARTVSINGAADGAFTPNLFFYNSAFQLKTGRIPALSLLSSDAATLVAHGVAPDSVSRLLSILNSSGIPLASGSSTRTSTSTTGSFIGRIDRVAASREAGSPAPAWWLTTFGTMTRVSSAPMEPMSFTSPTVLSSGTAIVQGAYSRYIGPAHSTLNETSSSVAWTQSSSQSDLLLPRGTVLVESALPTGTGIAHLGFGGGGPDRHSDQLNWQALNTTTILINGRPNVPARFTLEARYNRTASRSANDSYGTFSFSSLTDLEENRPAAYTRVIGSSDANADALGGSAAVGIQARIGNALLIGGIRADADRFLARPVRDTDADNAFGIRTDRMPSSAVLAPRLGFSWFYRKPPSYEVFTWPVATMYRSAPNIRGGMGLFADYLSPTLSAQSRAGTGLKSLTCVGEATPEPEWHDYLRGNVAIPSECAGEQNTAALATPVITAIDRGYRTPRSWRSTIGWSGPIPCASLSIDATYSLNLHRPGSVDLNFNGIPRFGLANEGEREVFVSPSSIVSATGLLNPIDARRDASFGPVSQLVSDLHGRSTQLALQLVPAILHVRYASVGYTYLISSAQIRGFDGPAASDPRAVEWMPSSVPRHQLIGQIALLHRRIGATMFARATSGLPFTPVVAGDINGDGRPFDRAFVFDPGMMIAGAGGDSTLRTLFAQSKRARDCLQPLIGTIATLNSCRGPWSAVVNASLFLLPDQSVSAHRVHGSIFISNLLDGFDRLFHGNHSHGWGTTTTPDRILYYVNGFSPVERQFVYKVNPRFASTTATALRTNPLRATIDVTIDLGSPRGQQELDQSLRVQLPLVGTRASVDSIKNRYMNHPRLGFVDVYGVLLRMADSLALSRSQADSLEARQPMLRERADSIYGTLAAYLASLPKRYDAERALQRVQAAAEAMRGAIRDEGPFILGVLTPGQLRLLPRNLAQMLSSGGESR